MRKIFITGAGGCVGHYLFDVLAGDLSNELYLLVRDPAKLKFNPAAYPNVKIIKDDLKNIRAHADLLKQMDQVVHLAADWAWHEGNLDYSLDLFELLDPAKCYKAIYFSTASILGPDNKPVIEAEKFGTNYVQGKYRFHQKLPSLKIYPRVVTLFPTWVLGGDDRHPRSHATQGIIELKKWLRLIRFITFDASFHFIHAQDIAAIVKYLLENEVKEKEFVLGNAPITANQFLKEVCAYYKVPVYFQLPVKAGLVRFLAALFRQPLLPWDRYCLERRNFVFQTVNAATFRLPPGLETVPGVLRAIDS